MKENSFPGVKNKANWSGKNPHIGPRETAPDRLLVERTPYDILHLHILWNDLLCTPFNAPFWTSSSFLFAS